MVSFQSASGKIFNALATLNWAAKEPMFSIQTWELILKDKIEVTH